jgi:hypothetical protein
LENLDDDDDDDGDDDAVDINRDWESTRENIKVSATESLGYYELKLHKDSRLNCSGCRIQVKKEHSLNNVRCETNRTFRNKKREYLKEKIY